MKTTTASTITEITTTEIIDHVDGHSCNVQYTIEWNGNLIDSEVDVLSVNGLHKYKLDRAFLQRIEWAVLRKHEANLEKEIKETKAPVYAHVYDPSFCVECGDVARLGGGFCSIRCQTEHYGE